MSFTFCVFEEYWPEKQSLLLLHWNFDSQKKLGVLLLSTYLDSQTLIS